MISKKGIDVTEDCENISEAMRQMFAMQAMESGKPLARHLLGRPGGPMTPFGGASMPSNNDPTGQGKTRM